MTKSSGNTLYTSHTSITQVGVSHVSENTSLRCYQFGAPNDLILTKAHAVQSRPQNGYHRRYSCDETKLFANFSAVAPHHKIFSSSSPPSPQTKASYNSGNLFAWPELQHQVGPQCAINYPFEQCAPHFPQFVQNRKNNLSSMNFHKRERERERETCFSLKFLAKNYPFEQCAPQVLQFV